MISIKLKGEIDSWDLEVGENIYELLEHNTGKRAELLLQINGRTEWVLATFKKSRGKWILDKNGSNNIVWDYMYCVCGRAKVVGPESIGGNVISIGVKNGK